MEKMKTRAMEYDDPWRKFKTTILSEIEFFKEYSNDPYFLEEIHLAMKEEYVEKGIEIAGPD